MSSNAPEMLRRAMSTAGLEYVGEIHSDCKLHRFKAEGDHARNSWYVFFPGPPAAGAFGCWKRGIKQTWCERNGSLSSLELELIRQRWEEATAKLETETVARQSKARKIAAWILNRSRTACALDRYLCRKRVKVFGDLRVYRRSLVLPLRDKSDELHSLQFINGDGTKKFLSGSRVSGCFFTLADEAHGPLVVCEGYATGASIHQATNQAVICAMDSGNLLEVAKAARERWPQREIIIAADNDQFTDGNPGLTKATAAAKAIRAKLAVPQFKDLASRPTDFNDLATAEGFDGVKEQLGYAKIPTETDIDVFARLATLSPADYDRCREPEAAALGIRVTTLDAEIQRLRRRVGGNDSMLQGCAINLPDVEPWPEPVNGAEILDAIAERFLHYVVMPEGSAEMLSLWCAHTHTFKSFQISPRVHISAPMHECGKTTLRDCASLFCARPKRTDSMSTAVMFRLVTGHSPTILADECDKWLFLNEELVGLICSGHRKGGTVLRCEGDSNELREFYCYAPFLLSAIGALPSQIHSRSIVVRLERAKNEEIKKCAQFDLEITEYEHDLCRKLARWIGDNGERIAVCKPKLPENLFNRVADNWRPLFQIAEVAGGDWPKRCATALVKLTTREDDMEGLRVELLADTRQAFTTDRTFSKDLTEALAAMKERPWSEICRGKPITERWLARNLAVFGIHPKSMRIGEGNAKGYERSDFDEAFARYLPDTPIPSVTPSHTRENGQISSVTRGEVVTDTKNKPSPREKGICDGVADKKGDTPENADFGERDVEGVSADVDAFLPNRERIVGKEKLRL